MTNLFEQLLALLNNHKVGFINIVNYTNKQGETSDYLVNVGFKYAKLKARDLVKLTMDYRKKTARELILEGAKKGFSKELIKQAIAELKQSIVSPNQTRSQAQINAYVPLNNQNNVKFCLANGSVKLTALSVRKTVKVEGIYKQVNSKPITLCKKFVSKITKQSSSKIRYFDIDVNKLQAISINGVTLTIQF